MYSFDPSQPEGDRVALNGSKSTPSFFQSVKRQITRNRASYSCMTCRRRKVKCDKIHPVCGGCQKANEQCSYSDDASAADSQTTKSKVDNGHVWKKRKSSIGGVDSTAILNAAAIASDGSKPPADFKAIEEQLQRLTKMVDALRSSTISDGNQLRLKELLTPEHSSSDSVSDGAQHRPSLSLDMFQSKILRSTREPADLSTPFSSLRLSSGEASGRDRFWSHITDELDQLNHLMRRRDNTYAGALSPENKQCDRPRDLPSPTEDEQWHGKDDSSDLNDFHKEAGVETFDGLGFESGDSVGRLMAFSKSSLLQNVPLKCSIKPALLHLSQRMPTRAQSNVLFSCWLSGVYPIIGIFMPSEISTKHEAFWDDLEAAALSDIKHPDLDFLTVLHAIWYAGSLSISARGLGQWFPHASRARLSTQFHDHTVFCLLLTSFKREISLYKLGALVLLQSMPIAEEDPLQRSLYLALVVRLALTMGLHREPTLFELSVSEEGMRRLLWWQIIQLDISNVVASGYPSQISERFCDTRVVCEDRDAFTSETASNGLSSNPSLKSGSHRSATTNGEHPDPSAFRTLHKLARGKSIMACALRSVTSIHLETKKLRNEDVNEMKRIMTEAEFHVNDIINSIPSKGLPEMGFSPNVSRDTHSRPSDCDILMSSPLTSNDIAFYKTSPEQIDISWPLTNFHRQRQLAYNKWARISLSILMDKIHCVVYAPFLKNTKSKLWGVGRQCALHNCHSFLRKFVSLATDPDLEPFRWGWPTLYGSLHAVLIVLVDVYERPGSVEAPRSRELIDQVFAMAAPESGIVGGPYGVTVQRPIREGGVQAWDMLRGLRSAAWQRAGLDPAVLWTEEDQLAVGLATPLTEAQQIAQSLREGSIYDTHTSHNHNLWTGETTSIEPGVQYMLKLNQAEFSNHEGVERQPLPSDPRSRDQLVQGVDVSTRTKPSQGLARRADQRRMPFPLSSHMEKCSGKAAEENSPPDRILNMHNHVSRPAGGPQICPSKAAVFVAEAEAGFGTQPLHEASYLSGQATWQQSINNGGNNAQHDAQGQIPRKQASEGVHANGFADGYASHIPVHHEEQLHEDQDFASNVSHQSDTDMNLGFDWDKWDAVFGQYSGFTDLMEDETAWSAYVHS